MVQQNGFLAAVAHRQFLKNGGQWRHNARKDNIVDIRQLITGVTSEIIEQHRVLVRRALTGSRYHPMVLHSRAIIEAKLDIGIADIYGEQHSISRVSYT